MMNALETTNRSNATSKSNTDFNSISDQQLSKLSFKDTIKLFQDSEAQLTTDLLNIIKMILYNEKSNKVKDRKIKALVSMPQFNFLQRMKVFKILKTSPEFKPHILLINSIAEDLYNDRIIPRIDADEGQNDPKKIVSFSFGDDNTGKENVFKLPDRQITAGDGSSISLSRSSKVYYEDVNKPPIFESNLDVNKFAPLTTFQHAYMGLRYTEYDKKNKRYTRKFFRVGFIGMDHDHLMLNLFNKKFLSGIRSETNETSSVSTQTPISASQVKHLVDNIYIYFKRYKYYQFYTRNCNTFVKEISKSIGLNNISSLHNRIAPSLVANKAAKLVSDPDGSVDCFSDYNYNGLEIRERNHELNEFYNKAKGSKKIIELNEFFANNKKALYNIDDPNDFVDSFNSKNFPELEGLTYRDIKDYNFKEYHLKNTWNRYSFIENSREESRKDLSLFDKLTGKRFKNPDVEANIINIATNINNVIGTILVVRTDTDIKNNIIKKQNTAIYPAMIKNLNDHTKQLKTEFDIVQNSIKETIKLAGKNQINLNVYLVRTLNMLQKLISHLTETFERDEELETQELKLKHKLLMSEFKERSNTPSNSEN